MAVQSPRAQCDKKMYQLRLKQTLETSTKSDLFQGTVSELVVENEVVRGCRTDFDVEFRAKTVVVTTGTISSRLMHIGDNRTEGGRLGDFSAKTLSGSFATIQALN